MKLLETLKTSLTGNRRAFGAALALVLGAVGAFALQRQLNNSCCEPGASCCFPGSPCCAAHKHAER